MTSPDISALCARLEGWSAYWQGGIAPTTKPTPQGSLSDALTEAAQALRDLEAERDDARAGEELVRATNILLRSGIDKVDLYVKSLQHSLDQTRGWLKEALAERDQLQKELHDSAMILAISVNQTELDKVKKDAERYRFLRETTAMKEGVFIAHQRSGAISRWTTDEADRLIDSAIESAAIRKESGV